MAIGKGVKKPAYMQRVSYQSTLLGGMALLVTSILVAGNIHTRDAIAQRLQEDTVKLISQVIPASIHDNNLVESVLELDVGETRPLKVYQAMEHGQVSAVAYEVVGFGYSGPISIIMGVDREGKILGVRVISHTETPGLGDKIEESKSDWILGFGSRSLTNTGRNNWAVKKDGGVFDQFTGATITPRAVVKAVTRGLDTFETHKQAMLTALQPEPPPTPTDIPPADTGAS